MHTRSIQPLIALAAVGLAGLLCTAPVIAQSASSPSTYEEPAPIKVMVLGSFHFTRAPDFNDVMAPDQQAEIQAVVDSLAAFRPTKVVVEWPSQEAAQFDSLYQAYRAGNHELTPNERQQLGMRLAGRFGHKHIYSIDYKQKWGMQAVMDWAKKHDSSFVAYYRQWRKEIEADDDSLHRHASIRKILRRYNTPAFLDRIQEIRMRTLEVGAGSTYVGTKPVTSVYERNFRIFANLTHVAEPGDRIIVVYGAGHAYFFREFVDDHPRMTLVDPLDYL